MESASGGGSLKGSPLAKVDCCRSYQDRQCRSTRSACSVWALASALRFSNQGFKNFSSRNLLVTKVQPPATSAKVTTIIENATIKGIAGELFPTAAIAVKDAVGWLNWVASTQATKAVQPIVSKKISARHQGNHALATVQTGSRCCRCPTIWTTFKHWLRVFRKEPPVSSYAMYLFARYGLSSEFPTGSLSRTPSPPCRGIGRPARWTSSRPKGA